MDAIYKLRKVVGTIRDAAGEIEAQQIACLIEIMADHPNPITHGEIEQRVGLSQSSVSRNMKRLGVRMRRDANGNWLDAGLGLVDTRPDPYETRKLATGLTPKGVQLMTKLKEMMK